MSKIFLNVKMIKSKDEEPEVVAGITVYMVKNNIDFEVRSPNAILKQFLESTLRSNYFAVAPGPRLTNGYYANHAEYYYAGSLNYFTFLADKLSWYGLLIDFINKNELRKSLFSYDIYDFFEYEEYLEPKSLQELDRLLQKSFISLGEVNKYVYKAVGSVTNIGDYFETNDEGQRILKRVPPGFLAISRDGKIVVGGKLLGGHGVNLDKPDSKWKLVPSKKPFAPTKEGQSPQEDPYGGLDPSEVFEEYLPYSQNPRSAPPELLKKVKQLSILRNRSVEEGFWPSLYPMAYVDLEGDKDPFQELDPEKLVKLQQIFDSEHALNVNSQLINWLSSEATDEAQRIRAELEGKQVGAVVDLGLNDIGLQEGNEISPLDVSLVDAIDLDKDLLPRLDREVVAYSKKLRVVVPGTHLQRYSGKADDWLLFDASDYVKLSEDERALQRQEIEKHALEGELLIHPALLPNIFEKPFEFTSQSYYEDKLDVDLGVRQSLAKEKIGQINSLLGTGNERFAFESGENGELTVASVETLEKEIVAAQLRQEAQRAGIYRLPPDQELVYMQRMKDEALRSEYFERNQEGIFAVKESLMREWRENVESATPRTGIKHFAKGYNDITEALRPYQEYGVRQLTDQSRYGVYGGPQESQGMFLNWAQGIGKTMTVLAADAVMRNRGTFKRSTLVIAPNNILKQWKDDAEKYRQLTEGDVIVIEGNPEERRALWKQIEEAHLAGRPPKFIIMGAGKIRYTTNKKGEQQISDLTDADKREVGLDLEAIQRLSALQTKDKSGTVTTTGIFDAMVLDETGLYSNPNSNRHKLVAQITAAITSGDEHNPGNKGIVWGLNGDFSSNSAMDTISELSWVNSRFRDPEEVKRFAHFFTEPVHRKSKRLVFKEDTLPMFVQDYLPFISTVKREMAVGANTRIRVNEDPPLGVEFAQVHDAALARFNQIAGRRRGQGTSKMQLGLLSIMSGASFGGANPARMFEYGIGDDLLLKQARKFLKPEDLVGFMQTMQTYIQQNTQTRNGERFPKNLEKGSIAERNRAYEAIPQQYREAIEAAIDSWHNPIAERLIEQVRDAITNNQKVDDVLRLGFAGLSRTAIERISKKLRSAFTPDELRIQVISGGLSSDQISEMSKEHAKTRGTTASGKTEHLPPVITFVTGAVTYGLNLHSDKAWVMTTWSNGKLMQFMGRFQRNPFDVVEYTRLAPQGMGQVMAHLEDSKGAAAKAMEKLSSEGGFVEDEDEALEALIDSVGSNPLNGKKLVERLNEASENATRESAEDFRRSRAQ